tara:strand:+ start:19956 stop:20648 length:693 start_codon:yes stop_codon:yes gene_type:complete
MKSWVDFYEKRAVTFNSPEEIGCHYLDNEKISSDFSFLEESRIKELLNPEPHAEVYDLGCGAGYSSTLLSKSFSSVKGLDAGENIIRSACSLNQNIEFKRDDITELKTIKDQSINYALLYGVIYNMGPFSSVKSMSQKLSQKCCKGARVLISKIPNKYFYAEYQDYRKEKKEGRTYTDDSNLKHQLEWLWFFPDDIRELFGADFDIINILANPSTSFPLKAWFDALLVRK